MVVFLSLMFMLFPVITAFISLFLMATSRKYAKTALFFFAAGVSIYLLRYTSSGGDDSAAHYYNLMNFSMYDSIVQFYHHMMTGEIRSWFYDYSEYPLFGIFLYLISKTGIASLSSTIVSFITYYCALYPIVDLYQKNKSSVIYFILSILAMFFMFSNRFVASGMRYSLMMAIMVLLIYLYSIGKINFKKFIVISLIPISIHTSALPIVVLLVISKWLSIRSIFIYIVLVAVPAAVYYLPNLLGEINIGIINSVIIRIQNYTKEGVYIELFNDTVRYKMYIITLSAIILCLLYIKFVKKFENKEMYVLNKFTYVYALFTFGSVMFLNLWDRNIQFLGFFLIVTLYNILLEPKFRGNAIINLTAAGLVIILVITGIIHNYNMNNMFLIDYTFIEMITSNVSDYFTDIPTRFI